MATNFQDYPNLLNPECPWTPLREATGLPNVKWCEETLCGWISEPANTWSNVAYFVVAIALFFVVRKESLKTLRFWVPASFVVGITSLVYHASVTFVMQVLDFWGMYFYFLLVLSLNLVRMGKLAGASLFKVLWPSIFGFTALTVVVAKLNLPVQGIVAGLIGLTLLTEVLASLKGQRPQSWVPLAFTLVFIAIAAGFSGADASRAFCWRDSVFQGHAIWHVIGSLAMFASYFHYRQFRALYV